MKTGRAGRANPSAMCFTPAELLLGMLASCAIGIIVGAVIESRLRVQEDEKDANASQSGDPLT